MKSVRTTENLLRMSFLLSRAAFCSGYNCSDKELGVKSLCTSTADAQDEQISRFLLLLHRQVLQRSFKANWSGASEVQTGQHHLYLPERGGTNNPGKR